MVLMMTMMTIGINDGIEDDACRVDDDDDDEEEEEYDYDDNYA